MHRTVRAPGGPVIPAAAAAVFLLALPAGATLYETRIASFLTTLGNCTANPVTDSSPVASEATGPAIPYYGGIGGGTTTAYATRGKASAHANGNVTWGGVGNQAGVMGCFRATCSITDIVISGPAGEVSTHFFADFTSLDTGSISGFGERHCEISLVLAHGATFGYDFAGTATATHLASPSRSVTIGAPFTIGIDVAGRAWGIAPGASSAASYDLDVFASLGSGPVFDLPPGYTANSADGFIVDNLYVPPGATSAPADPRPAGVPELALAPNPFRGSCAITFELPRPGAVRLQVHDVTGRLVRTLEEGTLAAGPHSRTWDGTGVFERPVAAGVYFLRLATEEGTRTIRVVRAR
jgi:FlgD Ig-like domain